MNPSPSTTLPDPEGRDLTAAVPVGESVAEPAAPGRHRQHRFPARPHALKVLYGEDEHAMIRHAAEIAGLRPSSFVAMAALAMAEQVQGERHEERADEPSGAAERRGRAAPARGVDPAPGPGAAGRADSGPAGVCAGTP